MIYEIFLCCEGVTAKISVLLSTRVQRLIYSSHSLFLIRYYPAKEHHESLNGFAIKVFVKPNIWL